MLFFILFFAVVVFLILFMFIVNSDGNNSLEKHRSNISDILKQNNAKHTTIDRLAENGIAISEDETKLLLAHHGKEAAELTEINYTDILQVHILEDEQTTVTTSRSSQLGKAALGSVIAGGVGAIIGGLSAKQINNKTVKKISLQIVRNDIDNPTVEYEIIRFFKEANVKDDLYIKHKEIAMTWLKRIEVLINRADDHDFERVN